MQPLYHLTLSFLHVTSLLCLDFTFPAAQTDNSCLIVLSVQMLLCEGARFQKQTKTKLLRVEIKERFE